MNMPENCHTSCLLIISSIIAVQGLASDPERSWVWKARSKEDKKAVERGEKSEPVKWLEDLLPNDIPNARIMSFNYESRWQRNAPYQHIGSCARLLLDALHNSHFQVFYLSTFLSLC